VLNGCTDDSRQRLAAIQADAPGRVTIIEERRRGKSKALNVGIAATSGDLVGMIDDDEEVGPRWLAVIAAAFRDPAIDFVGGPYVACWDTPPPAWVPADYLAVLGAADNGARPRPYGRDFPGILKGGNAVIRRETLAAVGPYSEDLGPGETARLFSCEDEEMYLRLLEHGAKGMYLPDLVIYHHVSNARLTPEYYRQWCFWRGVSRGLMDHRHPLDVPYLGGVPRFLVGRAARGLMRIARSLVVKVPERQVFEDELRVWDLAGYVYGKHLYASPRFMQAAIGAAPRQVPTAEAARPDTDAALIGQPVDDRGSIFAIHSAS
jgi:GT2 family glycosyltransferase